MVRIWCVPVRVLNRQHLLGEHKELHLTWNVLCKKLEGIKCGYQQHPGVRRFEGEDMGMLRDRHRDQVRAMELRGYRHNSPLLEPPVEVPLGVYYFTGEEYERDIQVLKERQREVK